MVFWIITAALALVVAAMLGLTILRARPGPEVADYDLRVYRDQLGSIDRDLARGVIGAADGERIRAEVSRRILTADAQRRTGGGAAALGKARLPAAILCGLLVIFGSLTLYRELGAPGYGDLALRDRIEMAEVARSTRPGQAEAEESLPPQPPLRPLSPDFVQLMEQLRTTVAGRPNDLQGHILLARNEAASGDFAAAHAAQERVIALKGETATASDWTDYADMLILAAGGYVSPEAEVALNRALALDPQNGPARYYMALMFGQVGRPDAAFRLWQTLLAEGPADAPWIEPIRAQIEEVAMRAGVNYTLPPAGDDGGSAPGPTAADIEAAGEMSAEDRTEMIRGMVGRLSDRLATEGGPPEDWARLIGALGVLGDEAQAIAIYNNALEVFAGNEAALGTVRDGARQAGLIP
jgi:cytochrome c-type biogenesis protein CcmH